MFSKITKFLICEKQCNIEYKKIAQEIKNQSKTIAQEANCILAEIAAVSSEMMANNTQTDLETLEIINNNLPLACAPLSKSKIAKHDIDAMFSLLLALFNLNKNEQKHTTILKSFQNMIFCLRFIETNLSK